MLSLNKSISRAYSNPHQGKLDDMLDYFTSHLMYINYQGDAAEISMMNQEDCNWLCDLIPCRRIRTGDKEVGNTLTASQDAAYIWRCFDRSFLSPNFSLTNC